LVDTDRNVEISARPTARSTFSFREEENVERVTRSSETSTFSFRGLHAAPTPHLPHQPQ
jgi:hypothetical protein